MRSPLRWFVLGAAVLLAPAACGGKPPANAGEVIRPTDPTFQDARGAGPAAECHQVEAEGTPLVVDWKPEERGDLETAMRGNHVAVVHYDCKTIKLLQDCHVDGAYGFLGMTTKEQLISIDNADQAQANLPLHGAEIGASLKRGSSIDVGILMIGKETSKFDSVERKQLVGRCDGATHFVQSATVGAFAMKTGTVGQMGAKAALEVFNGVGASADSSSNRTTSNRDGNADACKQADVDAPKPPNGCGALIRIRLLGISEGNGAAAVKDSDPPKEVSCPKGLVAVDGKCAPPTANAPHDCDLTSEPADCVKSCDAGSAVSCGVAALIYSIGLGVTEDDPKATEFAKKGCDKGDNYSCSVYAGQIRNTDAEQAKAIYKKACDGGEDTACSGLADMLLDGKGDDDDPVKAARFLQRACDAGSALECSRLAGLYLHGKGNLKADPSRATHISAEICDTRGFKGDCFSAGQAYEQGNGVAPDKALARKYYELGCDDKHEKACARAKKLGK